MYSYSNAFVQIYNNSYYIFAHSTKYLRIFISLSKYLIGFDFRVQLFLSSRCERKHRR